MRRRRQAVAGPPDLAPETVAILLGGWSANPPLAAPSRPGGVDHDFLTLYDIGGIAKLWCQHEVWLREQARLWGWQPTFMLRDVAMFFGEYVANDGPESSNPNVEQAH